MEKVKNLLLRTLTSLSFVAVSVMPVLASGNPYNPYTPHKPVETGLANIETVAIIGAVLYFIGVSFLTYSQIIKKKFVK